MIRHRLELRSVLRIFCQQDLVHLSVAVHFYNEDLIVRLNELDNLVSEWDGAYTQEISIDAIILREMVLCFKYSVFCGAVGNDANRCTFYRVTHRLRHIACRVVMLHFKAFHVLHVRARIFGVFGVFIVASAAGKVCAQRVLVAGEGSVRNAVAILIEVTSPVAFDLFKVFFPEHLAAIHRSFRILERLAHPLVHAHVEIAQHEDGGLCAFGNVKSLPAEFKALVYVTRQQDDGVGITMTDEMSKGQVAL